jgi:hypothetical protein
MGVSRGVGRIKRPIYSVALIPRHCNVLPGTSHSSEFLRARGSAYLPEDTWSWTIPKVWVFNMRASNTYFLLEAKTSLKRHPGESRYPGIFSTSGKTRTPVSVGETGLEDFGFVFRPLPFPFYNLQGLLRPPGKRTFLRPERVKSLG